MFAPAPFENLRMFGYNVIYADPPWAFTNRSPKGEGRNPNQHYSTMSIEQIEELPVRNLAAENCALFLWVTDPLLDRGLETLRRWGFRYTTVAFTWAKRTKNDNGYHMGTGYYTRANPETCLLGMSGRMRRLDAGVRQLVVEPVRQHSRKPDRIRDDIVRLFGPVPRVELFARASAPGWDAWGNETEKFNEDRYDL